MQERSPVHVLRQHAQARLEACSLDDLHPILARLEPFGLRAALQERLMQRARSARITDEVRGGSVSPGHLYLVTEMLRDPAVSAGLLDHFLDRLRDLAYAG